jgi:sulfur-oxidizing protein SoxZ
MSTQSTSIKARIELKESGRASVRTLIAHPMLVDRTDPNTGKALPAHFIEDVIVTLNKQLVLTLEWGQAVSTNPLSKFDLRGVLSPNPRNFRLPNFHTLG